MFFLIKDRIGETTCSHVRREPVGGIQNKQTTNCVRNRFLFYFSYDFCLKYQKRERKLTLKGIYIYIYKSSVTKDMNCWDASFGWSWWKMPNKKLLGGYNVQNLWDDDDHKINKRKWNSTHGIGNHKIMEKTRINQQITTQLPHLIISFFL